MKIQNYGKQESNQHAKRHLQRDTFVLIIIIPKNRLLVLSLIAGENEEMF